LLDANDPSCGAGAKVIEQVRNDRSSSAVTNHAELQQA
jgi:hypothetical protein